jgi:pimeloyl-ACP methyl ester carboxylesterase
LVVLLLCVAAGGSLLSLDWSREHRAQTEALPVFSGFDGPVLVRIPANGRTFRARLAGDHGDGVIMLHGFPATSAMYEPLLSRAAADGYRAVAFDQRGYSPGARPDDIESYVLSELVTDVLAVADAVGFERFHLVGHDWGSAVGWVVAGRAPERVLSWTGQSIAHPAAFTEALASDPDQQRRSAYFEFFSRPWVPETVFSFNGMAALREAYEPMSDAQRTEYLRVFAEPGAMTAALNWYRALPLSRAQAQGQTPPKIVRPTLFIWGNADESVGRAGVKAQTKYIDAPYQELELDAGHWVLEEQTAPVTEAILAHWRAHADAAAAPEAAGAPAVPDVPVDD